MELRTKLHVADLQLYVINTPPRNRHFCIKVLRKFVPQFEYSEIAVNDIDDDYSLRNSPFDFLAVFGTWGYRTLSHCRTEMVQSELLYLL